NLGPHRFPQFLPDGRHFIYWVAAQTPGIYINSLDGGSPKRLADADGPAVISPVGFLLFHRQNTLFAQAFDLKKQELSAIQFQWRNRSLDFPQLLGWSLTGPVRQEMVGN